MLGMRIKKGAKTLNSFERNLLGFLEGFWPLEIAKAGAKRSDKKIKIPKKNADGKELLNFYFKLLPKRVYQVIKEVAKLKFPILDPHDLKKQFNKQGRLKCVQKDILISIPLTSYPIGDSMPVLKRSFAYTIMETFKECDHEFHDCAAAASLIERAATREKAVEACEQERQRCFEETDRENLGLYAYYAMQMIEEVRRSLIGPFPWEIKLKPQFDFG